MCLFFNACLGKEICNTNYQYYLVKNKKKENG
jgi:hypothetical protein